MIKIIILTFVIGSAWAMDSLEYAKLYSKISSQIYEIETEVQESTEKNIYIELEKFNIDDGQKRQFKVLVSGSLSFKFSAEFLLSDIHEENIAEQLLVLQTLIISEVKKQVAIREDDSMILEATASKSLNKSLGIDVNLEFTVLWFQLPGIGGENNRWLRTTISAGAAHYLDNNPLAGKIGLKTTIWSHSTQYASDLTDLKDKIVIVELGNLEGNIEISNQEVVGHLKVEIATFQYNESIRINDTLKFFYQGAIRLGVEYLIKATEHHSYMPLTPSIEVGLIISDKVAVKIGVEADLAIVSDWAFVKKDNALSTTLMVEILGKEGFSLFGGAGYNFVGENYNGSKKSGLNLFIGFRIKL